MRIKFTMTTTTEKNQTWEELQETLNGAQFTATADVNLLKKGIPHTIFENFIDGTISKTIIQAEEVAE